jgi:hypothetical protein
MRNEPLYLNLTAEPRDSSAFFLREKMLDPPISKFSSLTSLSLGWGKFEGQGI